MNEKGFQLGPKVDIRTTLMNIERFDAYPIASKNEAASPLIPDGEGEHAAQTGKRGSIPLQEGAKDNFRVATSGKTMAFGFEFSAQLGMIINLAVEDEDSGAIIRKERLIATAEIDDFE